MRPNCAFTNLVALLVFSHATAQSASQQAQVILTETGIASGLCVVMPATDGALECELARGGKMLVHSLTTDADVAGDTRARIEASGLTGLANTDRVTTLGTVPFLSNTVNLLVVDCDAIGPGAPADAEIQRAVSPFGASYVKRAGSWSVTKKALPASMDEWTHAQHTADGNASSMDEEVSPPNVVRWLAGPITTWGYASMRLSEGRAFQEYRPVGTKDVAYWGRNAFSGVGLWRRTDGRDTNGDNYMAGSGRFFVRTASGGVKALDAATGKDLMTYGNLPEIPGYYGRKWHTPYLTCHYDGKLMRVAGDSLTVVDVTSGDVTWKAKVPGKYFTKIIARNRHAYALVSLTADFNTRYGYDYTAETDEMVVCYDVANGSELWRNTDMGGRKTMFFIATDDAVVVSSYIAGSNNPKAQNNFMIAIDPGNGATKFMKTMFDNVNDRGLSNRDENEQVGVVGDRIYLFGHRFFTSYDLNTGTEIISSPAPASIDGCWRRRSSRNWYTNGISSYYRLDGSPSPQRRSISRNQCWQSFSPSYGAVYVQPDLNTANIDIVNAHASYATDTIPVPINDNDRIHRGHTTVPASTPVWPAASEWPIYLGNAQRGRSTPGPVATSPDLVWDLVVPAALEVAGSPVQEDWKLNGVLAGPITAPVIAGGQVFVAVPDANRVVAYDAIDPDNVSGHWSFTAGGRVDTPPTIYAGLCIFGSNDGKVYCLRATDGAVVWTFIATPHERKMCAFSQVASVGPCHGSLVVRDGHIWAAAGRHGALNGGVAVYKLDPFTGAIKWKTMVTTEGQNDIMTGNEKVIYVARSAILPKLEKAGVVTSRSSGACTAEFQGVDPTVVASTYGFTVPMPFDSDKGNSNGWLNNVTGQLWDVGSRFSAQAASISGKLLYTVYHTNNNIPDPEKRGFLAAWELDADGNPLVQKPVMYYNEAYGRPAGIAVAGDKICLASIENGDGYLDIYRTADGSPVRRVALPAGCVPIRDGIAVASGQVYITTQNGHVVCLGDGRPLQVSVESGETTVAAMFEAASCTAGSTARAGIVSGGLAGVRHRLQHSAPNALRANSRATSARRLNERRGPDMPVAYGPQYHPTVGSVPSEMGTEPPDQEMPDREANGGQGRVEREYWVGLRGSRLEDLLRSEYYPAEPTATEVAAGLDLDAPGHNYGQRLRALLIAPATDTYRFHIECDGEAQLWIAGDPSGRTRRLITHTGNDETEISRPVALVKGDRYYVEIVHKAGASSAPLRATWVAVGDPELNGPIPEGVLEQIPR